MLIIVIKILYCQFDANEFANIKQQLYSILWKMHPSALAETPFARLGNPNESTLSQEHLQQTMDSITMLPISTANLLPESTVSAIHPSRSNICLSITIDGTIAVGSGRPEAKEQE
jgi:hypothetical protein